MNRKNHDVEKQRYWRRTIGDAARSGMSIFDTSSAAPREGKPVLSVATQTESRPS